MFITGIILLYAVMWWFTTMATMLYDDVEHGVDLGIVFYLVLGFLWPVSLGALFGQIIVDLVEG